MRLFLILLIGFGCFRVQAQLPNEPFYENPFKDTLSRKHTADPDSDQPRGIASGSFVFDFHSLFFVRNNEYFTNMDPGHTWFGNQLISSVYWYPSAVPNLALRGGVFMLQHYGEAWPSDLNPVISLSYQYNQTRFVMGTLYGGLEHRLIEPFYAFERGLYDRYEQGFQVLHNCRRLQFDSWINWRQTTYPDITDQAEVFNSGLNLFAPILSGRKYIDLLEFNLQLINHHEGGAQNQTPVINHSNLALGLNFRNNFAEHSHAYIMAYGVGALDHSPQRLYPYDLGSAYYLNGGVAHKQFNFMLSYWYGETFFSPYGMPMMGSFAYSNPTISSRHRDLLFLRFMYSIPVVPEHFYTELRLEPIINFTEQRWDYSFGIYFIYKHNH